MARLVGQHCQHVVGVGVRLHPPQLFRDVAVSVDHEGRALDAHVRVAGVVLLDPDAVVLGRPVIGVGEQRERQVVLLLELDVRALVVRADAEHDCAARLELAPGIADPAGLSRAAGRVVLRIEVEDDRLAAEIGQLDALAGIARGARSPAQACLPRPPDLLSLGCDAMLAAHEILAFLVVGVPALAALVGGLVYRRRRGTGRLL